MRVGPLAAGALTRGARGQVASVHRRAVNLLLESGALVALLPEGAPLHPWALAAAVDCSRLTPGDAVGVSEGALEVGPLRVTLDGAENVALRLRARPAAWPAGAAQVISEILTRCLHDASCPHDARRSHDGPFDAALSESLARFQAGGQARDLVSLVGLGEGLTPSGDDALVGILAALDLLGKARGDASCERAALAAALTPDRRRATTALSAQMLSAAIDGLYAEPVLRVLEALAAEKIAGEMVKDAAITLLGMGHRSGADTLRGMAAALERTKSRTGYL